MGGHQAGEVAARETVSGLCRVLKRKLGRSKHYTLDELQDLLKRAIMYVNAQVFKMSRASDELRGMGTTLCCLLFHADGVAIGHVGDSRIYRMRGGHFEQMTKDHSLLREMVDQGQLDMQNATDFLYKNIITKAIGTEPKVEPTVTAIRVHHHDTFLMCTDGLSDMLLSKEIGSIVRNNPILHIAAETLVSEAIDEGGRDNITVVLIKILGADGDKDLSRQ
jgi:protein phosphatase